MNLREAYKLVLEDMRQCGLFYGKHDAMNANEHFMYGISTVMEWIAYNAGDDDFEDEFMRNMELSEARSVHR